MGAATVSQIPGTLRDLRRWMRWEQTGRGKLPTQPTSTLAVEKLLPFKVVATDELSTSQGIGFCLTGGVELDDGTRLVALDVDACVQPLTGKMEPWAEELLDRCRNTYASYSPSGTGIRIWLAVAEPPPYLPIIRPSQVGRPSGVSKRPEVQTFGLGPAGYVTETGERVDGCLNEILRFGQIDWLPEMFGVELDDSIIDLNGNSPLPVGTGEPPSFAAIERRVSTAPRGKQLLAGEWKDLGYPSASECAWELAKHVLRAAGNHAEQAIAFLQRSPWGLGLVDSRDPGKYGKARWWARELGRLVQKSPEFHAEAPGSVFGDVEIPEPAPDLEHGDGSMVLHCMADVEPKEIDWLWHGRIPVGRLSLIAAPPGVGKTYLTHYMAATVSKGVRWCDGSDCDQGRVVLVSCEDDPADTIRPRLDACGADVSQVHVATGVRKIDPNSEKKSVMGFTLEDLRPLDRALTELNNVRLVVVDPVGSYFGGNKDSHVDTEVRAVLAPLATLAARHAVAIVLVAHTRKSSSGTADDSVLGSRGFTGLARAVHHVFRDPDRPSRRLFLPGKNNLGEEKLGLAYRMIGAPLPDVVFEDSPVTVTADQMLALQARRSSGPRSRSSAGATEAWLRDLLDDGAERSAGYVKEQAKQAGISWRTVQKAANEIGIRPRRNGFADGCWTWKLSVSREDAIAELLS